MSSGPSSSSEEAIFVYKLSDDSYERVITSIDGHDGDNFGEKMYLLGDYIFAVSPRYYSNQGAVFVYKISDPEFGVQLASMDDLNKDDHYGFYIIFSIDYIIISAIGYHNYQGGVYFIEFDF